jgi:hypothetical protein
MAFVPVFRLKAEGYESGPQVGAWRNSRLCAQENILL